MVDLVKDKEHSLALSDYEREQLRKLNEHKNRVLNRTSRRLVPDSPLRCRMVPLPRTVRACRQSCRCMSNRAGVMAHVLHQGVPSSSVATCRPNDAMDRLAHGAQYRLVQAAVQPVHDAGHVETGATDVRP